MNRSGRIFLSLWLAVVLTDPAFLAAERIGPKGARGPDRAATPSGCPPLATGTDSFPVTAKLVMDTNGFGEPFVLRLSSAGQADATIARDPQVADVIDTEILALQLTGYHPRIGQVTLRRNPALVSSGQILGVAQTGGCQFAGGEAYFDAFFELVVASSGETWRNLDPTHIETHLDTLPPEDDAFEVDELVPLTWFDVATGQSRGQLFYTELRADPAFPGAGAECFDSTLTANLHFTSPSTNVTLFGFGPTRVERSDPFPGGYCKINLGPCQVNGNCPPFDSCVTPKIDTEIASLDMDNGFDPVLGAWSLQVLPAGGSSNCCVDHVGPGCTDPQCQDIVCGIDSFCCSDEWDGLCASLANGEPVCTAGCPNPEANPTLGRVQSQTNAKTYPANSSYDVFFKLVTSLKGTLHNPSTVRTSVLGLTNTPPNPETQYRYLSPSPPVAVANQNDVVVGDISNVIHTLQLPRDCAPPPAASESCLDSRLDVVWALPGCPTEQASLTGQVRVMQDDSHDPVGFGQDVIDSILASLAHSGTSACAGPVTLRLSPSDPAFGATASLTPEEFFPAHSYFDVVFEVEGAFGKSSAGPLHLATTINSLPPDPGEVYAGSGVPVDLLDAGNAAVGQVFAISQEILGTSVCPPVAARIEFAGPDEANLSITDGSTSVTFDVGRGDLSDLQSTGGSFSSALCLYDDGGPTLIDAALPTAGAGFYYVARPGFGAFNGSWNSAGAAQQGNRDASMPPCP